MSKRMLKAFLVRVLSLGLLWWVLTGGEGSSWWFGGPVILIVAAWRLDATAIVGGRFRPWQLVPFVPFYLWRSFSGSCDVAWRAMHWRMPIAPAVRSLAFRLPQSPARVFYANCVNMLPGTLTADWNDDVLRVHLLVDGPKSATGLRRLEDRVGLLFGYELTPYDGEGEE